MPLTSTARRRNQEAAIIFWLFTQEWTIENTITPNDRLLTGATRTPRSDAGGSTSASITQAELGRGPDLDPFSNL